jgi:hypothetical protein
LVKWGPDIPFGEKHVVTKLVRDNVLSTAFYKLTV